MAVRPIRISVVADADRAKRELNSMGRAMKTAITGGAIVAGAALAKFAADSVKSLARIERINAQTSAAIKSTGGAAQVSAKHVEDLAGSLEAMTATEAESIQTGANFLLTFTNVRNEAGKNNRIFDRTVRVMTDMSRAMDNTGGAVLDTRTQALQLGKALNDPIKGITALSRVGVSFTKQQKNQIEALVESGKTMDAQKVILRELEKEFGGSGEAFAKTTAGKFELAKHQLGTLGEAIMVEVMPALGRLADGATEAFADFEKYAPQIQDFGRDVFDLGKGIADEVVPPMVDLGKVAVDLFGWLSDLPGPVKEIGIQVGIAALVFPRLAAGVTTATGSFGLHIARLKQLQAEMTYTATRAQALSGAMTRVGAAASTAAGVGGMVLLMQAADATSDSMRVLGTTAGAALLGFSVGGPAGAAIGGTAALAYSFDELQGSIEGALGLEGPWADSQEQVARVTAETSAAIARQKKLIDALRGSIDGWSTSSETAALAHDQVVSQLDLLGFSAKDLDTTLGALGVSHRDLAKAAVGDADALQRVMDAYAKVPLDQAKNLVVTQHQLSDAIDNAKVATDSAVKAERERYLITQDLSALVGKLPKKVLTAVEATGIEPTVRGVAKVAQQYDLTRGEVSAVIEALGITATVRDVQKVRSNLKAVEDTTINLPKGSFGQGLNRGVATLTGTASAGGKRIGGAMGQGVDTGLSPWVALVSQRAVSMVNGALAGARNAADINSPSKKTQEIGEQLGDGLVVGMRRSAPRARTQGQKLMAAVLAGVDDGAGGVSEALDKVTASIRRNIKGKNETAREKAMLRSLRDEYRALTANGRAQDKNTRSLESAREKLAALREEYKAYADAIKSTVIGTGDVTQLGRLDDGSVSLSGLLSGLDSKVIQAERFTSLLTQLADAGLSRASVQQLLDAGPEAALATAEAIATGGSAAIAQMNALQARLAATGDELSRNMAARYYGAGVQAAQGIVKGLEAEAKRLDRAAVRMANALVRAVKRALGIQSPSRVFAGIGDNVVKGLDLGVDDTYVKRTGAMAAASLQKGFGTPALDAYTRAGVAGGGQQTVRVDLRLTAQAVDRLSRGQEVLADAEYAIQNGTRTQVLMVRG